MPVPARHCRFLVDKYDFSLATGGLTLKFPTAVLDAPTLQMTGASVFPGMGTHSFEYKGYLDGVAAGDMETEVEARLGTSTALSVAALLDTRTTTGCIAYVLDTTWGQEFTVDGAVADMVTIQGKWAEEEAARGRVLLDGSSGVATGTITDLGVAGATGGFAYLFVRTITGASTGVTAAIQSSTAVGFGTPTTLATFPTFTAPGVVAVNFSGAVPQYARINVSALGGATSITATCIICVNGVTQ